MTSPEPVVLDLIGVECPDFGLSLRSFFRNAATGTNIMIRSSAHNAARDVMALCEFGSHALIASRSDVVNDINVIDFIVKRG